MMKKNLIPAFILILLFFKINAQTTYIKHFTDQAEYESDSKITKATNGTYLFYGWTYQSNQTDSRGVLMKLNENGEAIFTKKLTHPDYLRIYSVDVNTNGELLVAGRIFSNLDQNFIMKTDSLGNEIWNTTFEPFIKKALWLTNGNILANLNDGIAVFDASGDTIFTYSNGGRVEDIAEAQDGNIIIYQDHLTEKHLEILKINTNGGVIWNKWYKYSTSSFGWEKGIKILPISDNEYFTMSEVYDFNEIYYITKHDSIGNVIWSTSLVDWYPSFRGVDLTINDNNQIVALFQRAGGNANDDCIIRLDSNGNFITSKLLTWVARASSIEKSWDGGYIIGGNYFEVIKSDTAGNIHCIDTLGIPTSAIGSSPTPIYFDTLTPGTALQMSLSMATITITNHNLGVETEINIDIPGLCFVGVNDEGNGNIIVWEKGNSTEIKEFKIYRESGMNYQYLGTVSFDSLSEFIDTVGVSPQTSSSRYKISAINYCDKETELSPHHQTVHLTSSLGTNGEVNLIWAPYQGMTFGYYRISRDTIGNGVYIALDSVNSSNTTYIDFDAATGMSTYIIEVMLPVNCVSTKSVNVYSVSRSNWTAVNISGSSLTGDLNGNGIIDPGEVAGDSDGNGVINGSEICGDTNGDGAITGNEIAGDMNGNGIIDNGETAGDINGNGSIQLWEKIGDINGDGVINNGEVLGDANGNGIIDNGEVSNIGKNQILPALNVFPNPTSGLINIESADFIQIELSNVLGEIILSQEIANLSQINISSLSSGIYFMKFFNNNTVRRIKIVKK